MVNAKINFRTKKQGENGEFKISGNQKIGNTIMAARRALVNSNRMIASRKLGFGYEKLQAIENGEQALDPSEVMYIKSLLNLSDEVLTVYCNESCPVGMRACLESNSGECANNELSIETLRELCGVAEKTAISLIAALADNAITTESESETVDECLGRIEGLRHQLQGLQLQIAISR